MQHAKDLNAIFNRSVEDEVIGKSRKRPGPHSRQLWVTKRPLPTHSRHLREAIEIRETGFQEAIGSIWAAAGNENGLLLHVVYRWRAKDEPALHGATIPVRCRTRDFSSLQN